MTRPRKYATDEERQEARRLYIREWTRRRLRQAPSHLENPLYRWRRRVKLTQREAGEILGVSASTVGAYERGITPLPEWLREWLHGGAITEKEARRRLGKKKEC